MCSITIATLKENYYKLESAFVQNSRDTTFNPHTVSLTYDLDTFVKHIDLYTQAKIIIEKTTIPFGITSITRYFSSTLDADQNRLRSEEIEHYIKYDSIELIDLFISMEPSHCNGLLWLKLSIDKLYIWSHLCRMNFSINASGMFASSLLSVFDWKDNDTHLEQFIVFVDSVTKSHDCGQYIDKRAFSIEHNSNHILNFIVQCIWRNNFKISKFLLSHMTDNINITPHYEHYFNLEYVIIKAILLNRLDFVDMLIPFWQKLRSTYLNDSDISCNLNDMKFNKTETLNIEQLTSLHSLITNPKYDSLIIEDRNYFISKLIVFSAQNKLKVQFVYLVTAFPLAAIECKSVIDMYLDYKDVQVENDKIYYLSMIDEIEDTNTLLEKMIDEPIIDL